MFRAFLRAVALNIREVSPMWWTNFSVRMEMIHPADFYRLICKIILRRSRGRLIKGFKYPRKLVSI